MFTFFTLDLDLLSQWLAIGHLDLARVIIALSHPWKSRCPEFLSRVGLLSFYSMTDFLMFTG